MDSFTLVIFGITSNLAQKYILHTLYDMEEKGLLPEDAQIIGNARSPKTDQEIKDYISEALNIDNKHHKHPIKQEILERLLNKIKYLNGHLDDPSFYSRLKSTLEILGPSGKNKIFYLATLPELYSDIFDNLQKIGLNSQKEGWTRLMVEKPVGHDLSSAKQINQLLAKYFSEDQIYRLDHYLGKETLQNILSFRFSNEIFEPLMNRNFIDHIQISATEDYGIGKRGGYFDSMGTLKDVGQNHQLQMLAFATMDAPSEFSNQAITKERLKVLKALKPIKLVLGQYENYHQEESVNPASQTDTYYALKTEIDNDRFRGVPIYIRAGKKLAQTVTEIVIIFKTPNNRLFKHLDCGMEPNILVYRIYPNEGIVLEILTKKPGHKIEVEKQNMQFCYHQHPAQHAYPDPYERLILDVIKGDQTFFNDAEEIEAAWQFIEPLHAQSQNPIIYKPGSWGPKEAESLLEEDGKSWIIPSMDSCKI